jgi:uncharacterized membrane protein YgdD (TMEM256/DUF423 family)
MIKHTNLLLFVGGILGTTAIAFGAYSEHKLRPHLSIEQYHSVGVALQYQLLHACIISLIGVLSVAYPNMMGIRRLKTAAWLFVIGIFAFSFSIYGSAITGNDSFKVITPTGGTILILGWATVVLASINSKIKRGL